MGKTSKKRKPASRTRGTRSRAAVKRALEQSLRKRFPNDTVDISDGYEQNIHVLVVSRQFDGMVEENKQDLVWGIIDGSNLTDNEKSLISLVLPLSPAQIK